MTTIDQINDLRAELKGAALTKSERKAAEIELVSLQQKAEAEELAFRQMMEIEGV